MKLKKADKKSKAVALASRQAVVAKTLPSAFTETGKPNFRRSGL
jgi:hypothetical protein